MNVPVKARSLTIAALLATLVALPARAGEVTFFFRPSSEARTVTVAGTFNDWNSTATLLMDADGDGVWTTTLDVPAGRQMYKFVVNGTEWFEDRTAGEFVGDGFGGVNSVMEVGDGPMTVGVASGDAGMAPKDPRTEVTFRFRSGRPRPNAVSVAGSFNGWDAGANVLTDEDGDGVWEATVRVDPGRAAYQFVLNGQDWLSCDKSVEHDPDGFGGRRSVILVGQEPMAVEGPKRR